MHARIWSVILIIIHYFWIVLIASFRRLKLTIHVAHMQDTGGFFIAILEKKSEFRAKPESDPKKVTDAKPPISAIVDEIESRPAPVDGGSVAPKIEAADALTGPTVDATNEVTPVARQNQENPTADATVNGKKRSAEDDEEDVSRAKKQKVKEEIDAPAESAPSGKKRSADEAAMDEEEVCQSHFRMFENELNILMLTPLFSSMP
jgi:multisite-specific tRNA:(cytosine-C5)-methyltransferase